MVRTIDVTDLPGPLVDAIESIVRTYWAAARQPTHSHPVPPIGWLKGRWELPDTFFEPLPDDLLDLFEGGGETAGRTEDRP